MRTFDLKPAARERVPLLLGIVGPSSSGKTYSALRLATGMQRVIGGEIAFIDTEAKRGTHYADQFKFLHMDFQPPFGPLDYLAAIETAVKAGAKVLVIDSMTHEHAGIGGVMDQSERFLEAKAGDDWKARERMLMLSLVRPKGQRKKLNAAIVQLGVNAVLCYRAAEKIKPLPGKEPVKMGWQPETTSTLYYDMTQRFLLTPGCDGRPSLFPETDAEKRLVKNPAQFRDIFREGFQLDEDTGQRLAEWAAGVKAVDPVGDLMSRYESCRTPEHFIAFTATEADRAKLWPTIEGKRKAVKDAADAARKRVTVQPATTADVDEHGTPISPPDGRLFDGSGGVAH